MNSIFKTGTLFLIGINLVLPSFIPAQNIVYFEDFEKGSESEVGKISRYPMFPEVVTSDPIFPGAFPPPSGKYAARARDHNKKYFGLGSIVAGPLINITNAQNRFIAIQAKIYLTHSQERFNHNFALIAVDDNPSGERYYRFGYFGGSVYFRYFTGAKFEESLFDPDLGDRLKIPGWHTFTMRFDGPGKIYLYVDNQLTSFSPVIYNEILQFKMGVLGLDRDDCCPIISDDFCVIQYSAPLIVSTIPNYYESSNTQMTAVSSFKPESLTVRWYDNPGEAELESRKTGKKFLLFFHIPNHQKTQEIEKNTLSNPLVLPLLNKFILVKLDGSQHRDIVQRYKIYKFPTLMIIDIKGRIYWEHLGKISPQILSQTFSKF